MKCEAWPVIIMCTASVIKLLMNIRNMKARRHDSIKRMQHCHLRDATKEDAIHICRIMRQLFYMNQCSVDERVTYLTKAFASLGLKFPRHWNLQELTCRSCEMDIHECVCCVHGKPSVNFHHTKPCMECGCVSILEKFGYFTNWVCSECKHRNTKNVSECEKCSKVSTGYIVALTIAQLKVD